MAIVGSPMTIKPQDLGGESSATLLKQDESILIRELFSSVRYGMKAQVAAFLSNYPQLANLTDNQGFTCVHWASKNGDREMLKILADAGASLDQRTVSEAKMMPIHWAASDGKISSLSFFLERRQDINAQDANGCTPVIIAAQHNQLDCVIYLIKNGADTTLRDTNGDNALHWGAYKGYVEMVGLLTYLLPHELDSEDIFGQTPLHLGALRGNVDVVEYLIKDCGADTTKRDRNGLNALELTVKKFQVKTEWTIRSLTQSGTLAIFLSIGFRRLRESTILMYLFCGSNEREITNWPWRIVFLSNLLGSVTSFTMAMSDTLSDLGTLHFLNSIVQVIWWICFSLCLLKNPTFVRDGPSANTLESMYDASKKDPGQKPGDMNSNNALSYSSLLDHIGNSTSDEPHPQLCHSCRVVRTLRSKHCKLQRRCIQRFDHFCPFVGNTLGHDNYKYFISLLFVHIMAGTLWQITAIYSYRRIGASTMMTIFMIYSGLWMVLILSLFNYHLYLLTINVTTNEQINKKKYGYFKDEYADYHNPFNQGSACANIADGLFPSLKSYYSRDDVLADRSKTGCSHEGCHHCEDKGHGGDVELGESQRLLSPS